VMAKVEGVGCPAFSSGILRDEHCLDKRVQPVQIDIGEDWGCHTALRGSAERCVPFPVLQVSGLQHLFDQPEEPVIVEFLRQDREHDLVIETPETVGEVSLDEPGCPAPCLHDLAQRGVAATAGTETVRAAGEQRFVVRLQ